MECNGSGCQCVGLIVLKTRMMNQEEDVVALIDP
eukprot:COSAG02_NODE_920_length_15934_cov_11.363751_6_plen_34_part_00